MIINFKQVDAIENKIARVYGKAKDSSSLVSCEHIIVMDDEAFRLKVDFGHYESDITKPMFMHAEVWEKNSYNGRYDYCHKNMNGSFDSLRDFIDFVLYNLDDIMISVAMTENNYEIGEINKRNKFDELNKN